MKRKTFWVALTCLMVTSMVLVSCNKTTLTTSSTSTTSNTSTSTVTTTKTNTATTSAPATTTSPTTSGTGHWWDSLGKPQYGGELVIPSNTNFVTFDPYASASTSIEGFWFERLFTDDWTLNPSVWDYKITFRPNNYVKGLVAESWEFTAPGTLIAHIRQGIHWQNIAPVNGREFTASDVAYHYHREYGFGDGFTKPSPFVGSEAVWQALTAIDATDKYTVVFKFTITNPEAILETIQAAGSNKNDIEAREAVQQWGDLSDWHHAIGTGPFILQDFVPSSSATLIKNPNYWGNDERYPQNKLPYVDTVKYLIIPDNSTTLAAMRTGKIDVVENQLLQDAQSMKKTNQEILQLTVPVGDAYSLEPRDDVKPFNDVNVRKAMQMAINLPEIASTYYGGTVDPSPSTLTSNLMTGWGFAYSQWPQDLKDEYAYNPTAAKKLLATAGYPNGFDTNVVADTAGDLQLLEIIKSYFAKIGINMSVKTMDNPTWINYVLLGHKQDQLAYRAGAGGWLGHTYEPTAQFNVLSTGFFANYTMTSDPVYDAAGAAALAASNIDGLKQALTDANKEVARQHFIISLLQPNTYSFYQPWVKGYNGQTFSLPASSPGLKGFYQGRFWIDQNLKKSMGH
jgi:peptide/nickel transport system substrate-binding protein